MHSNPNLSQKYHNSGSLSHDWLRYGPGWVYIYPTPPPFLAYALLLILHVWYLVLERMYIIPNKRGATTKQITCIHATVL